MRKGFTLIELLAVIVILAIIALIATPIIINIINESRIEGRKRSAEAVAHAFETQYLSVVVLSESSYEDSSITIERIMNRTRISNEASRGSDYITTKDGIKCTIAEGQSEGYTVTCVDTKSNDQVVLTKDLLGKTETGSTS